MFPLHRENFLTARKNISLFLAADLLIIDSRSRQTAK